MKNWLRRINHSDLFFLYQFLLNLVLVLLHCVSHIIHFGLSNFLKWGNIRQIQYQTDSISDRFNIRLVHYDQQGTLQDDGPVLWRWPPFCYNKTFHIFNFFKYNLYYLKSHVVGTTVLDIKVWEYFLNQQLLLAKN